MSEYQYYEFQAIDRRLTDRQTRELRRISTRAVITAAGCREAANREGNSWSVKSARISEPAAQELAEAEPASLLVPLGIINQLDRVLDPSIEREPLERHQNVVI